LQVEAGSVKQVFRFHKDFLKTFVEGNFTVYDVIKEAVQNAYQADADECHITIHPNGDMEIEDRGLYAGMAPEDFEAFFVVGTPRQRQRRFTEHYKRPVPGQFGIGRLSFYKLYKVLHVETEKDGRRWLFVLTHEALEKVGEYEVEALRQEPVGVNGTKLVFMGLREGVQPLTPERVKSFAQSSFEFLALSTNFKIYVNGEEVDFKTPKMLRIYERVDEPVDGVSVKEGGYGTSKLTGYVGVSKSPLSPQQCGVQLVVMGSPIGSRRTLGELAGDRGWDAELPVDRITGIIEAPFLKPSISRQWVDTNDLSYLKFADALRRIAQRLAERLNRDRLAKFDSVREAAAKKATEILTTVLRADPSLWPSGLVHSSAYGASTPMVAVLPEAGRKMGSGRGWRSGRPERARQVAKVHVGSENGSPRGRRWGKASGFVFEFRPLQTEQASYYDRDLGAFIINMAHPSFQRRDGDKRALTRYLLNLALKEVVLLHPSETASEAHGRMLALLEGEAGELIA
jgi:hypothetical protein